MPIDIKAQIPKIKSAITPRLMIYFTLIAGIGIVAASYGLYQRSVHQQQRKQGQLLTQGVDDAATSGRQDQDTSGQVAVSSLAAPQPAPAALTTATQSNPNPSPQPESYAPQSYSQPPQQPQVSPAQLRRQHLAELEQQAIEAPTGINQQQSAANTQTPSPYTDSAQLSMLSRSIAPQSQNQPENNPNDIYLHAVRTQPMGQFELWQGIRIPATLDAKLTSDNPGQITVTVNHDVYDSLTGKYVLIPATSHLVGEYDSHLAYAQNRIQVFFTVINFPDGSYLNLGRMNGYDGEGASGLKDQVDNHWKRIISGALLTSVLSAGFQVSQNHSGNNSVLTYPSTGEVIAAGVGTQTQQLGQQITSRNLAIPPTITVRPGDEVEVLVSKRISFDGPYHPIAR